jgi:hypothetical protein
MPRSTSGRVVILVEPQLKRRLHSRLAADGRSLKEWFVEQANIYVARHDPVQLTLPEPDREPEPRAATTSARTTRSKQRRKSHDHRRRSARS